MRKVLSFIIIGLLVFSGLGAAAMITDHNQNSSQRKTTTYPPNVDELDQSMTIFEGALPVGRTNIFGFYANLSIAQSFIPQKEVLTRTQFRMARNVSTSYPCVLAIRENLSGKNLAIISAGSSEFPPVNETPTEENQLAWINFNFTDIWVTPGYTYYLVVYTANVTDNFYWVCGNGSNIYINGTVYYTLNDGKTWSELVNSDGCFKTYGLRETFLEVTMKGGILVPSFLIKNIGNYTAWDIVINLTVRGGFLGTINLEKTGSLSELPPGNEITVKLLGPPVFGFGKVTITISVRAANVKEMSIKRNATVFLFFIIGVH
jgi:hypothetical protein